MCPKSSLNQFKVMDFNHFIGVDVSKKTLDLSVRDQTAVIFHMQVDNSRQGIKTFTQKLKEYGIAVKTSLVCLEHTGLYNVVALDQFYQLGYSVWLESAVQIKRSMGLTRGKNDKIDAQRIADYAYRFSDKVALWEPSRDQLVHIKQLTTLRRRLLDAKVQLNTPLKEGKAFLDRKRHQELSRLCQRPIEAINQQISAVEREIRLIIQSDQHLAELFEIVTSVDGVGEVLFWELVTTTDEFKRIADPKKYACYAGIAPFEHTSGTSIRGKSRISRMGNKSTKRILHLAAMSAIVMKGELQDYYLRKTLAGKNKMATLNAVRNKLIHRIFACVRDGRKYEKTYTNAIA